MTTKGFFACTNFFVVHFPSGNYQLDSSTSETLPVAIIQLDANLVGDFGHKRLQLNLLTVSSLRVCAHCVILVHKMAV